MSLIKYYYSKWHSKILRLIKRKIEDLLPRQDDEEEVKGGKRIKDFNSQKIFKQTSNIISTNKSRQ